MSLKRIDTNFDPMPTVNSLKFKEEYLLLLKDKTRDMSIFFKIIDTFIESLASSLLNDKNNFFFYIFLKKNIESIKIPIQFLNNWLSTSDLKQDFAYIICNRLRNANTIPHNATPVMAKYYFITDLRLATSNFIKKKYRMHLRNKPFYLPTFQNYELSIKPKISSNFWYNYIEFMIKSGYSITELSKLTGYSRVTLYKELKNDYKKTSN